MEKMIQNPGVNVLELSRTYIYVNSYFNFYQYNLSTINLEYDKIIKHKNEILTHINKYEYYANGLKTYENILKFNCEQLKNKIKIITSHRNKRGIINGLGSIVKAITGNLDATDGQKYDELFEKINQNMHILQTQNLDTVKLNKEMIIKFNKQLNNIKHNEETLSKHITEIKTEMNNNYNWRMTITIKDALNQLILLAINLKEIISEIETSLSFCGMNKIHSSIIDMETLRKIAGQKNRLDFLEISNLIKTHCRLESNTINYLIEIPIYDPEEKILYQVTPIPIVINNKLHILNENEELITMRRNEIIAMKACIKNKDKYYCHANYQKTLNCFIDIIKKHENKNCKYHEIKNPMLMLKIKNSDIVILASNRNVTAKLHCNDYVIAKTIIGVYKVKTNKNCTLNGQKLEIAKYYNKEIVFEDVNVNFEKNQLMNETIELNQISEQNILIKELHTINDIRKEEPKFIICIVLIIISMAIMTTCVIFKKRLCAAINHVKRHLALGELRRHHPTASAETRDNRCVQTGRSQESAASAEIRYDGHLQLERGHALTASVEIQPNKHVRPDSTFRL